MKKSNTKQIVLILKLMTFITVGLLVASILASINILYCVNTSSFFTQFKNIAIVFSYSFSISFLIFRYNKFILPFRVSSRIYEEGFDASQHNEKYLTGTLLVHNNRIFEENELPH